jgi:formate-dependent nitrite reductase membrane component NrfD
MAEELFWGLPVISYLFLAGVGAGAMTVSASIFLRGGDTARGLHVDTARYGAFLAPLPIMIGCGLLILELGSFEVGDWFKWINLYMTINLSPMSIGTWLLTLTIGVSIVYAYTYLRNAPGLPDGTRYALRRKLSWVAVPLGIATAVYTGVLLGAMPSRPFWNSPILALLFLISSLSTGIAGILLLRALFHPASPGSENSTHLLRTGYLLTASDVMLIGFELAVVFLFVMFAYLTVGDVRYAISVILSGGDLALLFWLGFVAIGLLLPALVELYYVIPKLLYHRDFAFPRGMEIGVAVLILIGGFILRYVVVVAGQVTGPVGV